MGIAILVPGADYSEKNIGQVTIHGTVPVTGVSIIGPDEIATSGRYRASFTPPFCTQRGVTWSITSGSQYANISEDGTLTAREGASSSPVTLRCTSTSDSSIYAEKNVSVTAGDIIIKNYIQGDGVGFFAFPGMYVVGGKITYRGTYSTINNTYNFHALLTDSSGNRYTRLAMYTNSSGRVVGTSGTQASGPNLIKQDIIYRFVWTLSSTTSATDGHLDVYNDATGTSLFAGSGGSIAMNSRFGIFTWMTGSIGTPYEGEGALIADGKFYGLKIEKDGEYLANYTPCIYQNQIAIIDLISETVYLPTNGEGLTVG